MLVRQDVRKKRARRRSPNIGRPLVTDFVTIFTKYCNQRIRNLVCRYTVWRADMLQRVGKAFSAEKLAMQLNPAKRNRFRRDAVGLLRAFLLYLCGYMPLSFAIAFLEGTARGDWAFTLDDWIFQSEAFAVTIGLWLAFAGLVSVPLLYLLQYRLAGLPSRTRAVIGAVLGAPAVLFGTFVVAAGKDSLAWMMLVFPLGYVGAATLYGAGVACLPHLTVRWFAALAVAVIAPATVDLVLEFSATPPPAAIVYFKPGLTDQEVNDAWAKLQDRGIRGWTAVRDGERRGVRLEFAPRTSLETRQAILSRARQEAFVDEIADVDP